jgi:tetratricopeptide (TPR) repeat protein
MMPIAYYQFTTPPHSRTATATAKALSGEVLYPHFCWQCVMLCDARLLGVGIVTYATENIWDYTAYSLAVNEVYAEHNGYIMLHLDPATAKFDAFDARWNKIKILEKAIDPVDGWARNLDYVMWVDADLIFLDIGLRLEQVAAANPKAHVIISAEHAGSSTLVNSGTVTVRNSNYARKFLSDWWSYADRKMYSDQEQFDLLYNSNRKEYERRVAILPPDALNSDPPAMTKQKSHNQVLHLMGEHTAYRQKAFGTAFREICRKIEKPRSPPLARQLLNTRDNLHRWTLESYYDEMTERFASFEKAMVTGDNDIKAARLMANSVHHYAHALSHRDREGDDDYAVSLRNRTFVDLLTNLNNRRVKNQEHLTITGRPMEDWPELMKCCCEAGQHMTARGTSEQKKAAGAKTMALLHELVEIVAQLQRPAVELMIASLHLDLGLIDYYDDKLKDALVNFKKCLSMNQKLAKLSGDHITVQPMEIMANTYSQLGEYTKAFQLYENCIKKVINHLGPNHESLAEFYLNYATAKHANGSSEKAKEILSEALRIFRFNGVDSTEYSHSTALRLWNRLLTYSEL